jgi:hypothetical protein
MKPRSRGPSRTSVRFPALRVCGVMTRIRGRAMRRIRAGRVTASQSPGHHGSCRLRGAGNETPFGRRSAVCWPSVSRIGWAEQRRERAHLRIAHLSDGPRGACRRFCARNGSDRHCRHQRCGDEPSRAQVTIAAGIGADGSLMGKGKDSLPAAAPRLQGRPSPISLSHPVPLGRTGPSFPHEAGVPASFRPAGPEPAHAR